MAKKNAELVVETAENKLLFSFYSNSYGYTKIKRIEDFLAYEVCK